MPDDIKELHTEAVEKGILILMEMGLDPGLDHMTAMKELDQIRSKGGDIISFKSYTGGVIAPESDNNPWHYKITWNPRNIVQAGNEGARFVRNNKYKFIPYTNIFSRLDAVNIPTVGLYDGYANRDSLKYKKLYDLSNVPTLLRGTLRKSGFCQAWDVLVKIGLTNDAFQLKNMKGISYREFTNAFLRYSKVDSVEQKIADFIGVSVDSEIIEKIEWLGLFSKEELIPIDKGSPSDILQALLEKKWKLSPDDKDMIVMQHIIEYEKEGNIRTKKLSMIVKGDDAQLTSMAKTVGYPISKAVELLLTDQLKMRGVQIPLTSDIYDYVLQDIEEIGVSFIEEES
ncbi:MAG: saccharopine dehydrogenase C-terminal domain-containing protein [Cyclobacteriaceae bacterium]